MEKIDLLLEKLDGRIPASLGKKIDKLDDLYEKLKDAQQEFLADDSDENNESLGEITDYIEEFEEEIVEQLETLVNNKRHDVAKAENKQQTTQQPIVATIVPKDEKKESSGVLGLVIGAVLLVGSLGAINYFKNNR
jgi:predicted phage tail protein